VDRALAEAFSQAFKKKGNFRGLKNESGNVLTPSPLSSTTLRPHMG
jgi:hypothetical protein